MVQGDEYFALDRILGTHTTSARRSTLSVHWPLSLTHHKPPPGRFNIISPDDCGSTCVPISPTLNTSSREIPATLVYSGGFLNTSWLLMFSLSEHGISPGHF
ncbi:hypothetical protein Cob_v003197 [Colletotrichum orbiculare MAFF 240422]|uniref:Uncharacterized protein n=1 Tax=Colletotrichum orbiculare (strain 104-T / ATCC 96160 / CBS 514.97 / LARS 414 / MAFF 240422) TaxID=1213857 RepID=A0A484G2K9_COLOR|nr:hypothetical protein Cob_v003197 [Colletotrichum orbiculare MAFF 240422]